MQNWDSAKLFLQCWQNQLNQLKSSEQNFTVKIKSLEEKLEAQQKFINNRIEVDKLQTTIESQNQIIQTLQRNEKEYETKITKRDQQLQFLSDKVEEISNSQKNQIHTFQSCLQNLQNSLEKYHSELENKTKQIEQQINNKIDKELKSLSQFRTEQASQQLINQFYEKLTQQDERMQEIQQQIQIQQNNNQKESDSCQELSHQTNQQLQKIEDQININDLNQQYQNQNAIQQNLNQNITQEQNNQNSQQDQALQNEKIIQNQQFQENQEIQEQNNEQFQIKKDELKKQNEYLLDNKKNQKELNNKIDQQQTQIIQEEKNLKIQQQTINELNDLLEKLQNEQNQIVELNDSVYQDIAGFDQQINDINEQFKSLEQINISQYKPKGEKWNSFTQQLVQIQQQSKQQPNLQSLLKLFNELKGNFESANSLYKQASNKQINQTQIQSILQNLNKIKQQLNIQKINKSRDECEEIIQNLQKLQLELQYYQENYKKDFVNNEQLQQFTTLVSQQRVNTDIHQLKNQYILRNQQFIELLERKKKIDQFCQQHQIIINSNQQIQELQQQINQIIDSLSQMINFPENEYQQKKQQFTNLYQQFKIFDKSSLNETDKNMQLFKKQFDQYIDQQHAQLQELLQVYKNFDELSTQVIKLFKRLTYTPPDAMITKFIYTLYQKTTYLRAIDYKYKPFVRCTEDSNELKRNYALNMHQGKEIKQYCNEIKPVRGDGNCFYTAFGFQFLKYLVLKYNDKEFDQFLKECEQIKMPMKLFLSEKSPEITNKELENKMLIEFFNRLRRLRKIENLKERLNQLEQEFAAYEQSEDQIEQDGCLYALTTIFLRNYSNYAVDFHEMKAALFDRQNLLIWEKECNSTEIVIDALSRKLKLHSILIFIQKDELIFQKYGNEKYWKIILLMKPGHYNIGVDTAYEGELIKQFQDEEKKQVINR